METSSAGKGDTYRPVNAEAYDEGYKRAFGVCNHQTCAKRYTCLRWLKTPEFGHKNVFDFGADGTPCSYFIRHIPGSNPDVK